MTSPLPYYRRVLNQRLVDRIEKNPKYSLRAFARQLGMDSSALSQILSGNRFLSEKLATRISDDLALSPDEREEFLTSLAESRAKQGLKRWTPEMKARLAGSRPVQTGAPTRELSADLFRIVADWYHYAILELTHVRNFSSKPKWIAARLGITVPEAVAAIERLQELELLEMRDGRLVKTDVYVDTSNRSVTAPALKRRQHQIIEKSLHSLENHPIEVRNHSARTVAIDPRKIGEAKLRIDRFLVELSDFLGAGEAESVYEVSVQLFPLESKIPASNKATPSRSAL